ncbi:hypothetical protein QUA74_05490 [Microcoleus sp. LAD1_D3]|uniref:hypothetical protein n=1 Tax=Microcoleus sp. LAD1_D3 TaxID=2819365 RepID=UPI002FD2DC75
MAIVKVDRPDNSKGQTLLDSRAPRNRVFSSEDALQPTKTAKTRFLGFCRSPRQLKKGSRRI